MCTKEQASSNRTVATLRKQSKYVGQACTICGGTVRYTVSANCAACCQGRATARQEKIVAARLQGRQGEREENQTADV